MLRFIANFFLFGLLFYLIYLFFPEAFHTLVSWADRTYEYLRDFFMRISGESRSNGQLPPEDVRSMLVPLIGLWIVRRK